MKNRGGGLDSVVKSDKMIYKVTTAGGYMKKKLYTGMVLVLAALGLAGCQKENKKTEVEEVETETESPLESFLQAEEEKYEYVMPEVYSEDATFDALADFLAAYYQIPEEELEETRYYYNYVDLNEDGTKEIIALTVGETTSTSMGECVLVLSQEGTDFTVISDLRNVRTPVVISDELTDGWHDLIYYVYGGGQEAGYLKCHYMGADGYQSTEEDFLPDLIGITGKKVLADNLIDDMDKGDYLTLVPKSS